MTLQWLCYSEHTLKTLLNALRDEWEKHKYLTVSVKTGKDRTLDQNAIAHVWYSQISRELHQDDALGVKNECKLCFGVPILRAEDPDFRAFYDAAIKDHLSYEEKLAAMDFVPVTSLMTTDQKSRYLVKMQEHYIKSGVVLEFPRWAA